jgi:antitoxin (DNA-binding transcriptional repressor) of toxin-antitoxin stability system
VGEISATEVARNLAEILDAIEHRGEEFTIVRFGRPIARLEPASTGNGADVKAALRRHKSDAAWADDLGAVRRLLELDDRRR